MTLQEQLNELYDEGKEHIEYQAQVLKNRHRVLPEQLVYLAGRTGMTPDRILSCARMAVTQKNTVYEIVHLLVLFYQNDAILTEKHKGDIPS